jgi:hypothetical protein
MSLGPLVCGANQKAPQLEKEMRLLLYFRPILLADALSLQEGKCNKAPKEHQKSRNKSP